MRHRIGVTATAAVLACLLLTCAARADRIYWGNFGASKISHLDFEGSGADVPIPPGVVDRPWGLAIDSATGKAYWANAGNDTIGYANLDGSGSGLLNTAGASVDNPVGLAIDPAGRRLYWASFDANKISYASLDGSGGGDLNTAGATVEGPSGVAVAPSAGRLYWSNYTAGKISYANLNGNGGADLNTAGAPVDGPEGLAVDASASRVYWANADSKTIAYADLNGGGGAQLDLGRLLTGDPVGIAIEPSSRIYWANLNENRIESSSLSFAGGGRVFDTAGATTDGVAFPVLLEQPRNTEPPTVTGGHKPGSTLSCSQGGWAGDRVESFLYRAPQSFSYQWLRNGKPVPDTTAPTTVASKVGAYSCAVTGANFAGSNGAAVSPDFKINATLAFRKTTFNRRKGTATVRVSLTGSGRLDAYGKGVANAQRKHVSGTAEILVRASGKALIKLRRTGRARVRATIAYTPEGGKAIKRRKAIVLKRKLRR